MQGLGKPWSPPGVSLLGPRSRAQNEGLSCRRIPTPSEPLAQRGSRPAGSPPWMGSSKARMAIPHQISICLCGRAGRNGQIKASVGASDRLFPSLGQATGAAPPARERRGNRGCLAFSIRLSIRPLPEETPLLGGQKEQQPRGGHLHTTFLRPLTRRRRGVCGGGMGVPPTLCLEQPGTYQAARHFERNPGSKSAAPTHLLGAGDPLSMKFFPSTGGDVVWKAACTPRVLLRLPGPVPGASQDGAGPRPGVGVGTLVRIAGMHPGNRG